MSADQTAALSKETRFWDRTAPRYAKSPVRDQAAYEHTLDRVAHYLSPEHQVLELGCGTGTTAVHLAPKAAHITATDLSSAMIEIGKSRAKDAGVQNISFEACAPATAPKGPFDVVMGFNLLHLIPDIDAALSEIAERVPTGELFISKTPCLAQGGGVGIKLMLALALPVMQLFGRAPAVVHQLNVAELETAVEAAGFEIIETGNFPARPTSRFLVARRR